MDCSTPGLPVHYQLPEFTQTYSIESVMPSSHLIVCHPLLLPTSIFPSSRVSSNESVLRIRWPKYWSFSFRISPSNEYSGLISLRMDWSDLLAVQGTLKSSVNVLSTQKSVALGPWLSRTHCSVWILCVGPHWPQHAPGNSSLLHPLLYPLSCIPAGGSSAKRW